MKTYLIGNDANQVDIYLDDHSIAPVHLFLRQDMRGGYQIVDRSETGTFLWHDNQWSKVSQCQVNLDDKLTLGTYEISVRDLFAKHPALATFQPKNAQYYDVSKNVYLQERDPQTGEIIQY